MHFVPVVQGNPKKGSPKDFTRKPREDATKPVEYVVYMGMPIHVSLWPIWGMIGLANTCRVGLA